MCKRHNRNIKIKKTRKAFLGIVLMLVGFLTFAQEPNFQLGAKLGVNIASQKMIYKNNGGSDVSSILIAPSAGVYANYYLGSSIGVQAEILYHRMGASSIRLNYLAIPVLAKYKISKTRFRAYAGPQMGILLNAALKGGNNNINVDIKGQYKSLDVAALVGIEYAFKFGLNLSIRQQFGLSNIDNNTANNYSLRNNAASISVGYNFLK